MIDRCSAVLAAVRTSVRRAAGFALVLVSFASVGVFGEAIRFSADSVESVLASGRESTRLRGNALVTTDRVEIRADEIVISGQDNRFVSATGSVYIYEREKDITLSGDELFYDRTYDILRLTGNAVLEDRPNDILARAGVIENRGEEDLALIQIGVRILREDLVARAELVRFERDSERLELIGQPVVYSEGDEYRAERIIVDMKTDDIQLEGSVRGLIMENTE